jgi:uncharacterized membrane protein
METLMPGLVGAPNLHPMLVHFPIVLWTVAAALTLGALIRSSERMREMGRWALYLGTLSALATVASGFLAADGLGHDSPGHDLVHVHRNIMIGATVLGLAASAAAHWGRDGGGLGILAVMLVVATAGVMTLGADRGAALVYTYGMGVADTPPPSSGHDHGSHGHGEPAAVGGHHGEGEPSGADHHGAETPSPGSDHPPEQAPTAPDPSTPSRSEADPTKAPPKHDHSGHPH